MGLPGVIAFFRREPRAAFLAAVVLGALVTLLRVPLQAAFGGSAPFILAWPGMMLAALIGGFWPTLIVGAVGLAVGQWALADGGLDPAGPLGTATLAVFGLVAALAGGALKRGRRQGREDAARIAQLQSQMVNVARLNAMGEMAGSLAHELNQPLTALSNYLNAAEQVLLRDGERNERAADLVRKAGTQAVRAGRIVARVRASVDRGEVELAEESLSDLTRDAVEAAVAGLAEGELAIQFDFDGATDEVLADRIQIQQVVLNLVRNAVEATAGQARRELRIGSRQGDEGLVEAFVADNGPGVAPQVAERLFQPFVSGKPEGMGVGLSICRSIVEAHGGRLWAGESPEGGAAFHFTLQRADGRAAA